MVPRMPKALSLKLARPVYRSWGSPAIRMTQIAPNFATTIGNPNFPVTRRQEVGEHMKPISVCYGDTVGVGIFSQHDRLAGPGCQTILIEDADGVRKH